MLIFIIWSFHIVLSSTSHKSKYIKNRAVSEELKKREEYMMKEVKEGRVKCNQMLNKSFPYNVEKWVKEMDYFMSKPIYNQLMNLKGHEIEDEEYKN